jgi:aminoglycoside phosphotransferase (APT) family kinase protein
MHPRNIIIDRGRLSGIVDWECAGFYPEYWEFTKLFYGGHISPEILGAFVGDTYEEELEAERLLWYDTPFGA